MKRPASLELTDVTTADAGLLVDAPEPERANAEAQEEEVCSASPGARVFNVEHSFNVDASAFVPSWKVVEPPSVSSEGDQVLQEP